MLLNRYYGVMVLELPVVSVVRMARAAIEQEVRDELRPIWLVRLLADKLTGNKTPDFEEVVRGVLQPQGEEPSADAMAELESIAKRYREVQDGVDIPAVR